VSSSSAEGPESGRPTAALELAVPIGEEALAAADAGHSTISALILDAIHAAFLGRWTGSVQRPEPPARIRMQNVTLGPADAVAIEERVAERAARGVLTEPATLVAELLDEYLDLYYRSPGPSASAEQHGADP
jgi:hypothetical protein